jgi:alpha-amylase/alpha-mannosidase (GH57 family)
MASENKLKVILCWHMHQPEYRDVVGGQYQQPWTYLHAIKDYVDMAAHLESVPTAKAVVNFTPTLLEQLEDYVQQIDQFLHHEGMIRDPLLAALDMAALPVTQEDRFFLIKSCLRANEHRLINRFPEYRRLVDIAGWFREKPNDILYVDNQYLADLLMWYHLAWLGETVRRTDSRVKALMKKGHGFTLHERRQLLEIIGELIASVIPRYKALHERGQVELSMTPYAHPIMPLLLDMHSARDALPDSPLPGFDQYPGGEERLHWQMRQGMEVFKRCFGFTPAGCWPSEGSLSIPTLRFLQGYGIRWSASGQSVLRNSLRRAEAGEQTTHRPYRLLDSKVACFFRDDSLSDIIGFQYATWHADDAVGNLAHHLENIANASPNPSERVVSIIMDGENAWEYYPENAYYFLSALYKKLAEHPRLELTTFSACLDAGVPAGALSTLVAGSWVYGTLSTWIGDKDKNRGWEMLYDAKLAFDRVASSLSAQKRAEAERQLAICEGSDWFWWFGDYNPAQSVSDFDRLFRRQLASLYQILSQEPPEYLAHAFTHGGGNPAAGGVMRPGQ